MPDRKRSEAMPGVELSEDAIDTATDQIAEYFARANGHFDWSSSNTRRRDLRERHDLLRGSLKTAAYILASSGDLREKTDVDLLGFTMKSGCDAVLFRTGQDTAAAPCSLNKYIKAWPKAAAQCALRRASAAGVPNRAS